MINNCLTHIYFLYFNYE